jgi:hypothetical protein
LAGGWASNSARGPDPTHTERVAGFTGAVFGVGLVGFRAHFWQVFAVRFAVSITARITVRISDAISDRFTVLSVIRR